MSMRLLAVVPSSAVCLLIVSACAPPPDGSATTSSDGITGITQGDTGSGGDGDGAPTTTNGDGDGDGTTTTTTTTGDGDGDGSPTTSTTGSGVKFDLGGIPDGGLGGGCAVPHHNVCDDSDNDPWHALGINCPGEYQLTTVYTGHVDALYVHSGQLGTYNPATYPTLEGEKMVIMSSGIAQQLETPGLFASTDNAGNDPIQLPAPLTPTPVDVNLMIDCTADPNLVGTGDCSNTIEAQWSQGSGAHDYAELRITGEVPQGASGFSYNLAFFSTEYPGFYHTTFNDMYIAWLDSEGWTGNVSFDEMGHPISLNAGFLDYKDAPNPYDCPAPCTAPELQGTAMEGHAGTKWLTTTAGVTPGENFILALAVFDLSDGVLDTVVILDNFAWNCDGGPPITVPG